MERGSGLRRRGGKWCESGFFLGIFGELFVDFVLINIIKLILCLIGGFVVVVVSEWWFVCLCDGAREWENCRILPYILSKLSPVFDYQTSNFGV